MATVISRPKGIRASLAILKCCMPKGIPIIEIQSNNPKSKCATHVGNPPNTNQMIFMGMDKQPMLLADSLTVDPNGHRHKSPSFIVCTPKGIPMIVIIKAMEPAKYPMAHSRPPKINHIKFPKNFILRYCF